MEKFKLKAPFRPTGDQPPAIEALVGGLKAGLKHQVLLGVTGSGKTFTMANVIAKVQRPTLIISHNKTLAAQLCQEFREFFPRNAVEYFVSYYDYYQPEAYIPQRDQYIAKEADINEEIDKLRLSATAALMTRRDVIVVASVSCIYNLGSPVEYGRAVVKLKAQNSKLDICQREDVLAQLVSLFYERSDFDFRRSTFRVRGEAVDVWPSYSDRALRLEFRGEALESIKRLVPVTGKVLENLETAVIYPAKHYITSAERYEDALRQIRGDLDKRTKELKNQGKILEAHRLLQRTNYDIELIRELGYCNGIENYSRYFDERKPGEPPYTLLDYFRSHPSGEEGSTQRVKKFLVIIDESHITVPQLRGMYNGDWARKEVLIDHGFRLPSALDNRPLKLEEFLERVPQVIYTSATPGEWEIERAKSLKLKVQNHSVKLKTNTAGSKRFGVVEQLIRPTGLLDPEIEIRPTKGQIEDLVAEIEKRVKRGERVLVTTLTKRMAEDLAEYLGSAHPTGGAREAKDVKVTWLHADVNTLERTDILDSLRRGDYDVLVGINLLREGLDLPEVSLVAILDADKEGFLRSETSLIQVMGRAARHVRGKVIMYADEITGSMRRAIAEVGRRRRVQEEWNREHKIKPRSIVKPLRGRLVEVKEKTATSRGADLELITRNFPLLPPREQKALIGDLEGEMKEAAELLDFERAAVLRDKIKEFRVGLHWSDEFQEKME